MYQTMFAELGQRSLDAAWTADAPPTGRFTPATIKGKKYWYFDIPDGHGGTHVAMSVLQTIPTSRNGSPITSGTRMTSVRAGGWSTA